MLIDEIKNIKETPTDLKKFGLTIGIVLILISVLLFIYGKESFLIFAVVGVLFLSAGLIFPILLKPVNKVWMTFAIILGWIMTRVILSILFYLIITPIGLIAKLLRKDFLDLKIEKNEESYWIKRERKDILTEEYERQF